ncbi:MAG: response regulator [Pseudobdellovibrionaceae bacterium]
MESLTPTDILIVDDRPENIIALKSLLSEPDIRVHSASNADEALELLVLKNFGLALLDVQMPVMTGFELARLIRGVQRYKNLPIIFVTAQAQDSATLFEGYETGAVDVLFKPLNAHTVRSKVRVFVELHQQKRLLEKLKKDAEAATIAKSRFLANMSHEIRTPLSAVLGFSELLVQGELTPQEQADFSSAIRRNGELLKRLIDDILDLSKLEANKIAIEKIEFNLQELLIDVEKTLTLKASEKGIQLDFHQLNFQESVFFGDPSRIKQVLLNLAGNAIKFTEKGTVSLSFDLQRQDSQQSLLTLRVQDSGLGMTKEQSARLFQPFMQADSSTSRHYGGTGLGLVISREIVRAMDGDLRLVHSEPGVGSLFEATLHLHHSLAPSLPVLENSCDQIAVETIEPLPSEMKPISKVLLVDDCKDNLTLLQMYLRPLNLDVVTVTNGSKALDILNSSQFDLVLMDIQMPGMDGYETTTKIRAQGNQSPILALTAFSNSEDLKKCLKSGCNDVLTKPLDKDKLIQKVSTVLKRDYSSSKSSAEPKPYFSTR